jgi:F0F1-type ATP synthase membrane subunit c/vacuolar-type H+-ATPase subunit K
MTIINGIGGALAIGVGSQSIIQHNSSGLSKNPEIFLVFCVLEIVLIALMFYCLYKKRY